MFKVRVDSVKNILYISISGLLSVEDAKKIEEQIHSKVTLLSPGFNVINDLSKYIHGDEAAAPILKEIMFHLIKLEVNHIIRVVGQSKIGLIQFANNSPSIDQYKISYVPSLSEAEQLLSNIREKEAIIKS